WTGALGRPARARPALDCRAARERGCAARRRGDTAHPRALRPRGADVSKGPVPGARLASPGRWLHLARRSDRIARVLVEPPGWATRCRPHGLRAEIFEYGLRIGARAHRVWRRPRAHPSADVLLPLADVLRPGLARQDRAARRRFAARAGQPAADETPAGRVARSPRA